MSDDITDAERAFLEGHEALDTYLAVRAAVVDEVRDVRIEVRKTQISFKNRHLFAAVSFLPVGRVAQRPPGFLTLTLGLPTRVVSPRIVVATEPHPNRWTHHIVVTGPDQVDEELVGWILAAAEFADHK